MCDPLKGLRQHCRDPAPELDLAEASGGHSAASQRLSKSPTGGHGVLHGQIDSDTTDG